MAACVPSFWLGHFLESGDIFENALAGASHPARLAEKDANVKYRMSCPFLLAWAEFVLS